MYIMTYTTSSLNGWGRFCPANMDDRDRIGILDTDDMSEDDFTLAQFKEVLKVFPDLKVKNLKHNGKTITLLWGYGNNYEYIVDGDVCVYYEQKTNRGSYCDIEVYVKGIDKPIAKLSTQHMDGCYNWTIGIKNKNKDSIVLAVVAHTKNRTYELDDIVISISRYK